CAAAGAERKAATSRIASASALRCEGTKRFMATSLPPLTSKRRARFQRRGDGALVEIVELAADRHAVRQPRDARAEAGKLVGDVMRRRLALDGRVDGEDHLLHIAFGDPAHQPGDGKVVRPYAVE